MAIQYQRKGMTPRLRFSEFRDPWEQVRLSDLAVPVSDRVGTSECVPYTVTSGVGLVSQDEKLGRTIAGKSLSNYIRLRKGDFAYNKSATKAFPEGYIARLLDDVKAAVPNSIFTCFRADPTKIDPTYLDFLFAGNLHGRWLRKFLTIGARAHGSLNVSDDDLMALPVPRPSPAEQRRIAACLTSLDELLAAGGRKLKALLAHRRGLLQQIFPREGDSRPRLRFPEFRDAGEWDTRPLANVAENLDSKRVPITERDRTRGEIPYYGASGIVDYVDGYIFDEDLLCVSEDGANLVARTYPIAFSISGKSWVNNHAHVLRFDDRARQTLVEVYLNATDLGEFITGMAQPKLNRGMLDTIPIPLPPGCAEQQRIAGCLSSLNALIAAASRMLDGLRVHKKGLMQQLFPAPEGE